MSTLAERIAREKIRHEDALARLALEESIARLCPIEPYMVHFASKAEPWISYKVEAPADVLPLLDAYPPLPGRSFKHAGSTHVGPAPLPPGCALSWEGPGLVCVILEHGKGYRVQEAEWWTSLGGKGAKIKVGVSTWPWGKGPQCRVSYNHDGDVSRAEHDLPALGEWQRVKWAAGSREACRWGLYFPSYEAAGLWLSTLAAPVTVTP